MTPPSSDDSSYRVPAGVEFPDRHEWPVTLRAGGVVLRPLRWRDRARWLQVRERSAEWLAEWEPTAPPDCEPTPSGFLAMVRQATQSAEQGHTITWAVGWDPEHSHADRAAPVVGQLTLSGITLGSARQASVGYWIDHEHAGRGIIPTAVALACDYAFAVMRLHRIEICICPENRASLRVVEKLGFRHEGLRPRYLHIGGRWRDHEIFALHDDEVDDGLLVEYQRSHGVSGAVRP